MGNINYLQFGISKDMAWDTIAAWWGAIFGTLANIVIVWNFFRDRPRIKVTVKMNMKLTVPNPFTNDPNDTFVLVTAANVGRYPVYLAKAWFTLKNSSQSLLMAGPDNFKTEKLEPGLSRDFVGKQSQIDLNNLKEAYVCDAVGRKFKCRVYPEK